MSAGDRIPLEKAQQIADQLLDEFYPFCERVVVAGSIRRGKKDIGDIELVAIPKLRAEEASLWGDVLEVSLLEERLAQCEKSGWLRRVSGGPRYVKLVHVPSGLQVDLFVTTADQWGLILLIRTGPADWSQWLVTYARRVGLHVCGGRLRVGLLHADIGCQAQAIPTPTEEDVFRQLGLTFEAPENRGH
jgi:DNA polymerase/3'-5' exonuclease PolX